MLSALPKISENHPEIFSREYLIRILFAVLKLDLNLGQERTQVSLIKTGGARNGGSFRVHI
jgi:hypothetical protein